MKEGGISFCFLDWLECGVVAWGCVALLIFSVSASASASAFAFVAPLSVDEKGEEGSTNPEINL